MTIYYVCVTVHYDMCQTARFPPPGHFSNEDLAPSLTAAYPSVVMYSAPGISSLLTTSPGTSEHDQIGHFVTPGSCCHCFC